MTQQAGPLPLFLSLGERRAALLVTRAAAALFLDCGAQDLLQDEQSATEQNPDGPMSADYFKPH